MPWTDLTFPFASLLTSTKMTQLDDNFDALAAGNAGAPTIDTAAITALAVTTAKIASLAVTNAKIGTAAVTVGKISRGSGSASGVNSTTISLTDNSLFPDMGGSSDWDLFTGTGGVAASTPAIQVFNGTGTWQFAWRYLA